MDRGHCVDELRWRVELACVSALLLGVYVAACVVVWLINIWLAATARAERG